MTEIFNLMVRSSNILDGLEERGYIHSNSERTFTIDLGRQIGHTNSAILYASKFPNSMLILPSYNLLQYCKRTAKEHLWTNPNIVAVYKFLKNEDFEGIDTLIFDNWSFYGLGRDQVEDKIDELLSIGKITKVFLLQ